MYLIGLTGNIATGKSTVRRMLEQLGVRAIDADALSHAALLKGTFAWRAVVDIFGLEVLHADGEVDRQKLGALVFADRAKLQKLESIVHPAVSTQLALLLRDASEPVVVIEAIKLVEAGLDKFCDAMWLVTAPAAEQKRRLIEERAMSEIDAQLRLRAQPPLEAKLKLATVVIDNSRSVEATRVQVTRAFAAIHAEQAKEKTPLLSMLLGLAPTPASAAVEQTSQTVIAAHERSAEVIRPAREIPINVRRARPTDVNLLSTLLAQAEGLETPLSRAATLQRFGAWGFWLAEAEGDPIALMAWKAENLVAVARDLSTRSPDLAPRVFPQLLSAMEQEALGLACEVVLLISTPVNDALVRAAAAAKGYSASPIQDMHPVWRAVAKGVVQSGETIYLKRLTEKIVTRPI